MAYALVSEFVALVTVAEATALARATPPADPAYDSAAIQRALDDATATIDTYLAAKYATPVDPVPRSVNSACMILAREALDRQGRDFVTKAADRIRAWLKDVARGTAIIGGGVVGTDVPAPEASAGVQVAAPDRVFTDDSLAGYLR